MKNVLCMIIHQVNYWWYYATKGTTFSYVCCVRLSFLICSGPFFSFSLLKKSTNFEVNGHILESKISSMDIIQCSNRSSKVDEIICYRRNLWASFHEATREVQTILMASTVRFLNITNMTRQFFCINVLQLTNSPCSAGRLPFIDHTCTAHMHHAHTHLILICIKKLFSLTYFICAKHVEYNPYHTGHHVTATTDII